LKITKRRKCGNVILHKSLRKISLIKGNHSLLRRAAKGALTSFTVYMTIIALRVMLSYLRQELGHGWNI